MYSKTLYVKWKLTMYSYFMYSYKIRVGRYSFIVLKKIKKTQKFLTISNKSLYRSYVLLRLWLIVWWLFSYLLTRRCHAHLALHPPPCVSQLEVTGFNSTGAANKINYYYIVTNKISVPIIFLHLYGMYIHT